MNINNFKIDFIGIGAAKSGTTWVTDFLQEHPEVQLSEPKEPGYFNKRETFAYGPDNKNFGKPLDFYVNHFRHCDTTHKVGEFSTIYLWDETAPKAIKDLFPSVKLIACFRDPVKRAISHYYMLKDYLSLEARSLEDALRNEPEYIDRGKYFEQISRYLEEFPEEQIHFIFMEDIKDKPQQVLRDLCNFLVISPDFVETYTPPASNQAKSLKLKFIPAMMKSFTEVMVSLRLSWLVKFLKDVGLKNFVMKSNSSHLDYPTPPTAVYTYLHEELDSDIEKFAKLTGRDLSAWLNTGK